MEFQGFKDRNAFATAELPKAENGLGTDKRCEYLIGNVILDKRKVHLCYSEDGQELEEGVHFNSLDIIRQYRKQQK